MRSLLRGIYSLAIFVILLVVLNYLLLPQIIVHVLKDQIEVRGSEATGMDLSVESIKMNSLYPFRIQFYGVRAVGGSISLSLESADFGVDPSYEEQGLSFKTRLFLRGPSVQWVFQSSQNNEEQDKVKSSEPVSSWNQSVFGLPIRIPLDLRIDEGLVKILYDGKNWIQWEGLKTQLLKKSALDFEEAIGIDLQSQLSLKYEESAFDFPFRVSTQTLKASPVFLGAEKLDVSLGGIITKISGSTDLKDLAHQWDVNLDIAALEKLPVPAKVLPPGKWYGGMKGVVQFRQAPGGKPELFSNFKTENLIGDVDIIKEDLKAKGRLQAQLSWQLKYKDEVLSVPRLNVSLSSDAMHLKAGEVFVKQPGQALNLQFEGYVTKDVLVLKRFHAVLAQIKMAAAGFVGLAKGRKTDLTLRIPDTGLAGMEKLIPPMAKQPARGRLSVEARVSGDIFSGLPGMNIVAKPIRLSGFSTTLNYRDDTTKTYFIGPISANLQAIVRSQGAQVGRTTVQGKVDLTQLEIGYGDVFNKKMGRPLKLEVKMGNKNQSLSTTGSTLQIEEGAIKVAGTLSGFSDPRMNLKFGLNQLPVHQLLKMTGHYEAYPVEGQLSGNLSVKGQWKSRFGIQKSPLEIGGELRSNIRRVSVKTEEATQSQDTAPVEVPKLQDVPPLAPRWPVMEKSVLGVTGTIGHLQWNALTAKGISYKAQVRKGNLSATANIQKVFGGRLAMKKFQAPLLRSNPRIKANIDAKKIQMAELLKFAAPEYEKEVAGVVNAKADVSTELPSSVRFISGMKGLASLTSNDLSVSSLKLDQAVNEALERLPKAQLKPVKTEGFRGRVSMISAFSDHRVKLNTLNVVSHKKDELNLKGDMDLGGALSLRGIMSLAKPPLGGDIYMCNADERGRFVVPIGVKGAWNQPSLSFASSTVESLVKKTLSCQARREKKKLEKKISKELEETQKRVTEDLEKQAKDKLKDLFK